MMNEKPYIVVTDGGFPMGICTYLLTEDKSLKSLPPTAYRKVHTDENNLDKANSEQSVCVYEEKDGSVFIFVCNNTIGKPPCNGFDGIPEDGKFYNDNPATQNPSSSMIPYRPNIIAPGNKSVVDTIKQANYEMEQSYINYSLPMYENIFGVCNQTANKTGIPYLLGLAAVGVAAYEYKEENTISLKWKTSNVSPMSTIPCATPDRVFFIGIDTSNYTSVDQSDFKIQLISIDRETGKQVDFYPIQEAADFDREKLAKLQAYLRKSLDNVIYAGMEVFHNRYEEKDTGVLVWGSSFGFRTAA